MYSPGNHQKIIGSDDFKGNRSSLIHSNLLNIRAIPSNYTIFVKMHFENAKWNFKCQSNVVVLMFTVEEFG